jgi:hypothetical protein
MAPVTVTVVQAMAMPLVVSRVAVTHTGAAAVRVGMVEATQPHSRPGITSVLGGAGSSPVMATSSHPSRRIALCCIGRGPRSTMPTVSTTSGTATPGATKRSNHPPGSPGRLTAKRSLKPNCSCFPSKGRPTRNWRRIAQRAIAGLSPRQASIPAQRGKLPKASPHSVRATRVPIDYASKPATTLWSEGSRGCGPAEDAAECRNNRRLRPADCGNRLIILPPSAQALVQSHKLFSLGDLGNRVLQL